MSWALAVVTTIAVANAADGDELFEKSIRPVLASKCEMCHNAKMASGGIDFSSPTGYDKAKRTGIFGAAEQPEKSAFLQALLYDTKIKMPPTGKLDAETIVAFRQWLSAGAKWPGSGGLATRTMGSGLTEKDRQYWAFKPIPQLNTPKVNNAAWVRSPVDAFVLSKLEGKGLAPAAPAEKRTLLRRVTYDLTGLPPTDKEINAFLADKSPKAFENVVERLLASPRYGERWGRHWLDVVRFADSTGSDEDHRYPHAWRYRDYVIGALNSDMPYDRFVREQLAGDILAADPKSGTGPEGIVATGFLALGKKALAQKDLVLKQYDVVDDQIDVTGKALLGMTIACARCHDHKFDPILQKDYYGLASIYASTYSYENGAKGSPVETPLVAMAEYTAFYEKWQAIQNLDGKANKILDLDKNAQGWRKKNQEQMTAYMLAAYEVYGKGRAVAEVAKDGKLDALLLQKWIGYLSDRARPELARWRATDDATRAAVAGESAADFKRSSTQLDQDMSWWVQARRQFPKSGKVAGPRPVVNAEQNPFFVAVSVKSDGPLYRTEQQQIATLTAEKQEALRKTLAERAELERNAPTKEIPMACAVKEGKVVDQPLFVRGNHESPGEIVPKSFMRVIAGDNPPAKLESGSGRLDLANWLTSPQHPLTARVMANRIWQGHFSDGLVRTPDNFGRLGELPTHPELLDYLARAFIDSGWSMKRMHRLIVLSNTYQMSGQASEAVVEQDPENRLLAHFPKRRLTIEEIRDSVLAFGGALDVKMGGTLDNGVGTDGETSADRISMSPDKTDRRSVYLPMRRSNLPSLFSLYDFVDATTPTGKRDSSMVATQALFLMNSTFVQRNADALAKAVISKESNDRQRLDAAYLTVLARPASPAEADLAFSYMGKWKQRAGAGFDAQKAWQSVCRVLMASNEFVFVY